MEGKKFAFQEDPGADSGVFSFSSSTSSQTRIQSSQAPALDENRMEEEEEEDVSAEVHRSLARLDLMQISRADAAAASSTSSAFRDPVAQLNEDGDTLVSPTGGIL